MTEVELIDDKYSLLRDKVKSKMEVAKFFVGIVSVVFGLLVEQAVFGDGVSDLYLIALILLVLSIIASGGAIFAYDGLLLPPSELKHYCGNEPVNNFLLRRMIISWRSWFVPSVILYVSAMALLLGSVIFKRIFE